ncbi:MAG: hypothetical protein NVSMB32_18480 [Actinomycetota bacterium]
MSNVSGQAYALTLLCPVHPEQAQALKDRLTRLGVDEPSPFAAVGTTHFGRWVVVEQLRCEAPGKPFEALSCPYLLFSATLDGDPATYLRALCAASSSVVHDIWRHCIGYPAEAGDAGLVAYLLHNQVRANLFFAAYPTASVAQVHHALDVRRRLIDFAVDAQGMDDDALAEAFRSGFGAGQ